MYSDKMSKCCCDLFKIHKKTSNCVVTCYHKSFSTASGFLLRAGTRVNYPAMTLHVPGYRPDGRSFLLLPVSDSIHTNRL